MTSAMLIYICLRIQRQRGGIYAVRPMLPFMTLQNCLEKNIPSIMFLQSKPFFPTLMIFCMTLCIRAIICAHYQYIPFIHSIENVNIYTFNLYDFELGHWDNLALILRFKGIDDNLDVVSFSSKKVKDLGFQFKYSLEDMFVGAVEACRAKGLLPAAAENHDNGTKKDWKCQHLAWHGLYFVKLN